MDETTLSLLHGAVHPDVLDALSAASSALVRAGVRHTVIGDLAVIANGHRRTTTDVCFLVGKEAFGPPREGALFYRSGLPVRVGRVPIKLRVEDEREPFLAAALCASPGSFLEAASLVYMKLKDGRTIDRADVVELVKAGIDIDAVRQYLTRHAPQFSPMFEQAVATAAAEE